MKQVSKTPKRLASVNFTEDLLTWLDAMAEDAEMSRSAVVCAILNDYKESDKKIRVVVS